MGRLYPAGFPNFNLATNPNGLGFSMNFVPTRDIIPTKLYWYRTGSGATHKPTNLRLWDSANSTLLESANPLPDTGSVGQQVWNITDGPRLTAGRLYKVSAYYAPNQWRPETLGAFPQVPDYPCVISNPQRCATQNNVDTIPLVSCDNAAYYGLDLEYEEAPPPVSSGDVDAAVQNGLASWLAADADNTHQLTGVPYLSWQLLAAMEVVVNALQTKVDTIDDLLETALGATGSLLTGALKAYLDNLSGMIDDVQAAVGPYINDHTTAVANNIIGEIEGGTAHRRSGADVTSVGDAAYTITDTRVGVGAFTHAIPADRYVLTITNPEVLREGGVIDGIDYWKHRGFWAPLDGDIVGDYKPFVGIKHSFGVVGARLPGILCFLEDHIEWSLQSLDYTG